MPPTPETQASCRPGFSYDMEPQGLPAEPGPTGRPLKGWGLCKGKMDEAPVSSVKVSESCCPAFSLWGVTSWQIWKSPLFSF